MRTERQNVPDRDVDRQPHEICRLEQLGNLAGAGAFVRSGRIPGYVVGASVGGNLSVASEATRYGDEYIGDDARFPLGCLSKLLISLLVLRLAQDGRVSLDLRLADVLAELRGSQVSLRHLLTHGAGYREIVPSRWRARPEDLIRLLQEEPLFAPGTAFSYTQSGAALVVVVLEKVFGCSIDRLLNDHICDPIGMTPFAPEMMATADRRDATLFLWHDRIGRMMPFRLPKDTGILRYSMSGCTVSVPELIRIGLLVFDIADELGGLDALFAGARPVCPMMGNGPAERVAERWGLGLGDFGSVVGHTGSYIVSTAGLYLDCDARSVYAAAINTWDPEIRQELLNSAMRSCGTEPPAPYRSWIDTPIKLADLVGEHTPVMYGLGPLHIAEDGTISGSLVGSLREDDGGLALTTNDPILTLGVERHPQSGEPLVRLASSLCLRTREGA
jgi:CubicO group peptidase (beta-lactamase class C family)